MERRRFSAALQGQNLRFTGAGEGLGTGTGGLPAARTLFPAGLHPGAGHPGDRQPDPQRVLRGEQLQPERRAGDQRPRVADLPDLALASAARQGLDLLVVCGGLRTPLRSSAALREALQDVARGVALAGLWNGAWFLGDAGLLDGYRCCIHPEHRAALAEIARNSQVTSDSYMVDRDRLTAASPTGAFNLALEWIARRHGRDLVEAVVDILAFEESRYRRVRPALHEKMSEPLREVINLMAANIEEPLSQEQFAHYGALAAADRAAVPAAARNHAGALLPGVADHRVPAPAATFRPDHAGGPGRLRLRLAQPLQQVLHRLLRLPAVERSALRQRPLDEMRAFRRTRPAC